jgi:hypothetical protein
LGSLVDDGGVDADGNRVLAGGTRLTDVTLLSLKLMDFDKVTILISFVYKFNQISCFEVFYDTIISFLLLGSSINDVTEYLRFFDNLPFVAVFIIKALLIS